MVAVFTERDSVTTYYNCMRNTERFPHSKYEFCFPDFNRTDLRPFWELFGPHMKSVGLRQPRILWNDFYDVARKAPNLEKLTLAHLPREAKVVPETRRRRRVVVPPAVVPRQFPNVRELLLGSWPWSSEGTDGSIHRLAIVLKSLPQLQVINFLPMNNPADQIEISRVFIQVLRNPEVLLPNLTRINLKLELNNEGLEALIVKPMNLQYLNIALSDGVNGALWNQLVTTLRPTLNQLEVEFPDYFTNLEAFYHSQECVQLLTNLKALNMTNFTDRMNSLGRMTKLKNLKITTSNANTTILSGDYQNITKLQVTSIRLFSDETITRILHSFPHLNFLQLNGVNDFGLFTIYRECAHLSTLELIQSTCTDEGLTGVPIEICNDLRETNSFRDVDPVKYR